MKSMLVNGVVVWYTAYPFYIHVKEKALTNMLCLNKVGFKPDVGCEEGSSCLWNEVVTKMLLVQAGTDSSRLYIRNEDIINIFKDEGGEVIKKRRNSIVLSSRQQENSCRPSVAYIRENP